MEAIPKLRRGSWSLYEFREWRQLTEGTIRRTFPDRPHYADRFERLIAEHEEAYEESDGFDLLFDKTFRRALGDAGGFLRSLIDEVQDWEETDVSVEKSESGLRVQSDSRRVFIIHGRDDGAKETVARFIEKLGLRSVVLHEQPNRGRTIIEKFEEHSDVGFAVALLTPDDVGAMKGEEEEFRPRARQNVIFELGFFLGKIGRRRVCVLTSGGVEVPSDYDGVVYVSLDDKAWKLTLVRELKASGFEVDANLAL